MDVRARAQRLSWYHTLELAPGHVTDGEVDLRPYVERYQLPQRMDGMRALDIGTYDGFWAFEMERRGAEVVALDLDSDDQLDWPASRRPTSFAPVARGETFALAKETLGMSARREPLSVYDLTRERLGGFDIVLSGSILIHLRDPVGALERIAGVCDGHLVAVEAYHPWLGLFPFALGQYRALREGAPVFWEPNVKAWRRMMQSAGFSSVEEKGRFKMRSRAGWTVRHVVFHATM